MTTKLTLKTIRKSVLGHLSLFIIFFCLVQACAMKNNVAGDFEQADLVDKVTAVLSEQVIETAAWALTQEPVTVTASRSERSAGGIHDFYSEGDYWWPDPNDPQGPYIQRDGLSNPGNFVDHRLAMIRFSRIIGALASAYRISGEDRYVRHAIPHLKAWFVDSETLMNPSLTYAQAIHGRVSGRGIGIIDTIHLMEVAQGLIVMEDSRAMDPMLASKVKGWFGQYIDWLLTHPYGAEEMNKDNNHATCFFMQLASFAKLTKNEAVLDTCRQRYSTILLQEQMGEDGSFPRELGRTKPYGYSLFNLDAMATLVHLLSDGEQDLWSFQTQDQKSIKKGIDFLVPYVKQKTKWPFAEDVMYWENWPVAHPFLLFGAIGLEQKELYRIWEKLEHQPKEEEVIRNLPIRNPIIWIDK